MQAKFEEWLNKARQCHCDDIHINPRDDAYQVFIRYRGKLNLVEEMPLDQGSKMIRYIKYIANMEVGERRRPQDGGLLYSLSDGQNVELRISTIGNYLLQESLVVRLLHQNHSYRPEANEVNKEDYLALEQAMQRKSGLIIFSGPVASGKTTTIYQLLRQAYQKRKQQVITIENPVEIKESAFLQTEVNPKAGIDYDHLISASLRHHPDILVIGEVRNEHTARMMIRAALTGHLVLATIHAKNTRGVIGRLKELGITKEQLRQTLLMVTSQRLLPSAQVSDQQMVIYERLDGENLLLAVNNQAFTKNFKSLNYKLKEAVASGYISEQSYQYHHIEDSFDDQHW